MNKYVIWHVQGGLGKNVAATSLIPDLKEKYSDRKLVMVVSWPELFYKTKVLIDYYIWEMYHISMMITFIIEIR